MLQYAADLLKFALRQKASHILLYASSAALAETLLLYGCARHDHVLRIEGGVGLLQNFGLMSTLVANALIPYLTKLYYDAAGSLRTADAMKDCPKVQLSETKSMEFLTSPARTKGLLPLFLFIGLAFCLSNTSFHIFGLSESHWGHPVFDSIDHPASFAANRLSNLYTWAFLLPICAYICVLNTYRIVSIMRAAATGRRARFDLLSQEGNGGFSSLDRAQIYLISLFCIIYVQISFYTGTFKLNFEHISAYVTTTALLLFGNTVILKGAYASLRDLRNRAIREYKKKSYAGDRNCLEILLFYYENSKRPFVAPNWAIKMAGIFSSAIIKGMPFYSVLMGKIS